MNFESKKQALVNFFNALDVLRDEGIMINQKDFTCQVGEWLVEVIYEGKRAGNGIQKGWDVNVGGKHIQVKTHAKAGTNGARWSRVESYPDDKIDELIIIVFAPNYKLKEFYKVPWQSATLHMKPRGIKTPKSEINWSSIRAFRINIEELPHQEIISMFI